MRCNLMVKQYLIIGLLLFALAPLHTAKAEPVSEGWYVTTEDIIADIVFSSIDKRIEKEYGRNVFGWKRGRIVGIDYNKNHSYDVSMRIEVPSQNNSSDYVEDLVKARIYPSCDSPKIGCNHNFKVVILDYKHLSK